MTRRISKQVLLGLKHMHDLSLVHRDVKPGNILLSRDGMAKVSDFGIAKILEPLQEANTFVGTRIYMSPERLGSQPHSTPSDIWSFGLTMLTMALGEFPYSKDLARGFIQFYDAISNHPIPHMDDEALDPQFRDFISRCLEKDPQERWTCAQLLEHEYIRDVNVDDPITWPWDTRKILDSPTDVEDLEKLTEVLVDAIYSKTHYTRSEENDQIFESIATSLNMKMEEVRRGVESLIPIGCIGKMF